MKTLKVFMIGTETNPQCFLKSVLCSRYSVEPSACITSLHLHKNPIRSFNRRELNIK